jgi:hypothetical protein
MRFWTSVIRLLLIPSTYKEYFYTNIYFSFKFL